VSGIKRRAEDATLLAVLNAYHDVVKFALPPCAETDGWNRLFDTNDPALPGEKYKIGAVYEVTGRSMLLFERAPSAKKACDGAA
jgi:glycogen operon protein